MDAEEAAAADRAACTAVSVLPPASPWCCPQKECICLRRMFSMRAPHRVRMSPFSPAGAALGLPTFIAPGRSVQGQHWACPVSQCLDAVCSISLCLDTVCRPRCATVCVLGDLLSGAAWTSEALLLASLAP